MYHDKGSITVGEDKRNTKKYVVIAMLLGSVGAVAYFSQKSTATTNMQDDMEEMYEDMADEDFIYHSAGAADAGLVHEAPYGYMQEVDF
jgi:predicted ribosomally synthesized peptide with SipW-like signal peptide